MRNIIVFMAFLFCFMSLSSADLPTVQQAKAAWDADSQNDDLRLVYAYGLYREGRWIEAAEHFVQILERHPEYLEAAEGLASCRAALGDYDGAISALKPFVEKDTTGKLNDRMITYEIGRGRNITARCLMKKSNTEYSMCKGVAPKVFSIEGSFAYTIVSKQNDWIFDYERVSFFPYRQFDLALYHEGQNRYGNRDDIVGGSMTIRPQRLLSLTLDYFFNPFPDFLARHRAVLDITLKTPGLEELVFDAGYRFYDFDYGPYEDDTDRSYRYNQMITIGVSYYLPKGFFLGYRAYLVLSNKLKLVHAHQGYAGWEKEQLAQVMIGFSLGDEFISSQSSTGMFNQNYFLKGTLFMLCPFALTLQIQYTLTADSIYRVQFLGGVRYDF